MPSPKAKAKTLDALGKTKVSNVMKIVVNGEDVFVDPGTLTGTERQLMKRALAGLGYEPDGQDALYASIWVVMRRSDPALTFEDVCDAITFNDLGAARTVDVSEDDSPQA